MKPPYVSASRATAVSCSTLLVCPMTKAILTPVFSSKLLSRSSAVSAGAQLAGAAQRPEARCSPVQLCCTAWEPGGTQGLPSQNVVILSTCACPCEPGLQARCSVLLLIVCARHHN